jgi:hypothetical protein
MPFAGDADQIHARLLAERQIDDDQIDRLACQDGQRFIDAARLRAGIEVTLALNQLGDAMPENGMVIDDQHACRVIGGCIRF